MTALTLYPTSSVSSIATDNTLSTTAPGTETSAGSRIGNVSVPTFWARMASQSYITPANSATELAPNDSGWLYDSTALEGASLLAGTYTFNTGLNTNAAGATATADIHCRLYKRSSAGVFTLILDAVLTGQTVNHTGAYYAVTGSTSTLTSFGVGDKLYYDQQVSITAYSSFASNTSIATFFNLSTKESIVTPGYSTVTTSNKDLSTLFILSSPYHDLSTLFNLSVRKINDVATLFRLMSADQRKDLSTLLRLRSYYAGPAPMLVISRNCPAYTNDNNGNANPVTNANDSDYNTLWRTQALANISNDAYCAYDLSGVPTVQRGKITLNWNNNTTGDYDYTIKSATPFNQPRDYTVDVNAAAGGSLPSSGWVTRITVTGNTLNGRQHSLDFTGYNWIRINCTNINGTAPNAGCSLQMDIHNCANGVQDDIIFFGDSITRGGLNIDNGNGLGSVAQQINVAQPNNFPAAQGAGIGGTVSGDGVANIATWLSLFPGRFVALNYGTNDANNSVPVATFKANMQSLINGVIAAGCIPIIPHIPYGLTTNIQNNGPAVNTAIDQLVAANPLVIAGPDLWAYYQANQSLISGDGIHPTNPAGYNAYRTLWVNRLLATVYSTSWNDLQTLFRLANAPQFKDVATLLRLKSQPVNQDLSTLFALGGTMRAQDLSTLFRQRSANLLRDVSTLFVLGPATNRMDLSTLFVLATPQPPLNASVIVRKGTATVIVRGT